jgi:HPt (histidine-containing phosphotransfer) domain-containing protein
MMAPVLDESRLRNMTQGTTWETVERFAADYTRMLPHRVERIGNAVRAGDREAGLDAVLSLKTSSSFIGAFRMETICRRLQAALETCDSDAAEKARQETEDHLPHLTAALATRQVHRSARHDPPGPLATAVTAARVAAGKTLVDPRP